MISKVWVRLDGEDIVCVCRENNKKCSDKVCKEYIMKLIPVDRTDKAIQDFGTAVKNLRTSVAGLEKELRGTSSELRKSINRFKI